MDWIKPDENYWEKKIISYLHDPIDKVFDIKKHEDRANEIINILIGQDKTSDEFWADADFIAAGFERGLFPSYKKDEYESGAVNFIEKPIITHPTSSKDNYLNIELPESLKNNVQNLFNEVKNAFTKERDRIEKINRDRVESLFNKFTSLNLFFRFYLAYENVGGLGSFWHRIPADTRFPDHSIWQHNAITSAISSCIGYEDKNIENLGLMVFSITPVQSFISKARKLRDFWIGSIILSWLAFEGIIWVIENLGCDHIIYPSLIDQNLTFEYLKKKKILNDEHQKYFLHKESTIASFPNKFLFLIPFDKSNIIGNKIKNKILEKWYEIKDKMIDVLSKDIGIESKKIEKLFNRQFENYWELNWSSVRFFNDKMKDDIEKLLNKEQIDLNFNISKIFSEIYDELNKNDNKKRFDDKNNINLISIGTFYSSTHSLVQSLLAIKKTKKRVVRNPENGEKCSMCGEFEVVNTFNFEENKNFSAKDYVKNIKDLWDKIFKKYSKNEIKENERLCSICLSKRLFKRIIENQKDHILYSAIKDSDSFPQTTEIALYNFYIKNKIESEEERKKIAQERFENKTSNLKDMDNKDNYYAILKMDGDRMGDLINGETLGSCWQTIIHPNMIEKLSNDEYFKNSSKIKQNWQYLLEKYKRRMISPAIHMAISESLCDFSNYGVSNIIKKYDGRLIYAGGDDVCAVLPMNNVVKAALEIQKYYNSTFNYIFQDGNKIKSYEVSSNSKYSLKPGKLSVNLGYAECISISAGILICHHKENLCHMIELTEEILEKAKKEGNRNSLGICLKKRSGGNRYFITKWPNEKEKKLEIFNEISEKISVDISHSLIYNLEYYKDGINAIINSNNNLFENLSLFIKNLLKKSDKKKYIANEKDYEELASKIAKLIINEKGTKFYFNLDPLIIASFLNISDKC